MQWATRQLFESGLTLEKRSSVKQIDFFSHHDVLNAALGPPQTERRVDVENCRSKSIVKPTVEMQSLEIENLRTLFTLIAVIYSSGLLLLALEIMVSKSDRNCQF